MLCEPETCCRAIRVWLRVCAWPQATRRVPPAVAHRSRPPESVVRNAAAHTHAHASRWLRTPATPRVPLLDRSGSAGFLFASSTARSRTRCTPCLSFHSGCFRADFWFALAGGGSEDVPRYAPLDALDCGTPLVACGTLLFHEPETAEGAPQLVAQLRRLLTRPSHPSPAVFGSPPSSRASRVDLHDVCGWSVSYGDTPAAWVVTSSAWCAPSDEGPCVSRL